MFSETWYQQDADMLNLSGYEHLVLYRVDKRDGGVSIHVRQNNTEVYYVSTPKLQTIMRYCA